MQSQIGLITFEQKNVNTNGSFRVNTVMFSQDALEAINFKQDHSHSTSMITDSHDPYHCIGL